MSWLKIYIGFGPIIVLAFVVLLDWMVPLEKGRTLLNEQLPGNVRVCVYFMWSNSDSDDGSSSRWTRGYLLIPGSLVDFKGVVVKENNLGGAEIVHSRLFGIFITVVWIVIIYGAWRVRRKSGVEVST